MSKRRQSTQVPPEELARWAARIVSGPDAARFYCPHLGCNRSFAELWRLKVHFRAPPDVRGSGKERGHGTELAYCPKCGKDLHSGKHHVGCTAGKSAPRQAAKRQWQIMAQTTTPEDAPVLDAAATSTSVGGVPTEHRPGSAPTVAAMAAAAGHGGSNDLSAGRVSGTGPQCRVDALQRSMDAGEMMLASAEQPIVPCRTASHGKQVLSPPGPWPPSVTSTQVGAAAGSGAQQKERQEQQHQSHGGVDAASELFLPPSDLLFRASSPATIFGGAGTGISRAGFGAGPDGVAGAGFGAGAGGFGSSVDASFSGIAGAGGLGGAGLKGDREPSPFGMALLRPPSPPPLPPEWCGAPPGVLLFDFDQFDVSKRHQQAGLGASAPPLVTVTTAMQPQELHNPSDDYVWQILFAAENDPVPKRVTAHLHHPPEADDSLLWSDDPGPPGCWGSGTGLAPAIDAASAGTAAAGGAAAACGLQPPPPPEHGTPLPGGGLCVLEPTPLSDMLARDAARAAAATAATGAVADGGMEERAGLGA